MREGKGWEREVMGGERGGWREGVGEEPKWLARHLRHTSD